MQRLLSQDIIKTCSTNSETTHGIQYCTCKLHSLHHRNTSITQGTLKGVQTLQYKKQSQCVVEMACLHASFNNLTLIMSQGP